MTGLDVASISQQAERIADVQTHQYLNPWLTPAWLKAQATFKLIKSECVGWDPRIRIFKNSPGVLMCSRGWELLPWPRKAALPGSGHWFHHLLSNPGSKQIHYNDSSLLFTYLCGGSKLLSLRIFLWPQTEEQTLAPADCEKCSLVRGGISSSALRFPMGQPLFAFPTSPRQVKNAAAPRLSQLFCYLSDSSSKLTVPLKK